MDDECSKILTINSYCGIYKFDRLLFEVKVTTGIFPQAMDVMLGDLNFSITYLDNILIKSGTCEQQIEHISKVFKKICDFGFKLSEGKCNLIMK